MSALWRSASRSTGRGTPNTAWGKAFLETARRHADGASLPTFVEQEFRDFLTCGVLAHD